MQVETTNDFRNVNWGMSKKDVKKFEKDVDFIEEDTKSILGETNINSMDANIIYTFNNNKLNMCMIDIVDEHTNRNLYIDDYKKMKKLLTEKYGELSVDKQVWKNDLYKNDKDEWGDAVAYGHMSYVSQWNTNTTQIGLLLTGDNYKISLVIIYNMIGSEFKNDISGL